MTASLYGDANIDWGCDYLHAGCGSIGCEGGRVNTLYLRYVSLSGIIPTALGSLASLRYLSLGGMGLNGTIPAILDNLLSLRALDLGGNFLNGTIPTALGSLRALQILSLEFNALRGTIPPELCGLTSLIGLCAAHLIALETDRIVMCELCKLFAG